MSLSEFNGNLEDENDLERERERESDRINSNLKNCRRSDHFQPNLTFPPGNKITTNKEKMIAPLLSSPLFYLLFFISIPMIIEVNQRKRTVKQIMESEKGNQPT